MHVYRKQKQEKAIPPTTIIQCTGTYAVLLGRLAPHTHIYTKSKENKSHPHRQGGRQVRGPNVRGTWVSGQVHETEGSYPRPHGAMAGKPQCQRNAPDSVLLAWPVSSLRRSPRRHVFHGWHHGWGGERTGLPALSQHGWGGIVDARYGEGC